MRSSRVASIRGTSTYRDAEATRRLCDVASALREGSVADRPLELSCRCDQSVIRATGEVLARQSTARNPGFSSAILFGFNTNAVTLDPDVAGDTGVVDNPHRWTRFANVLYVDPREAGFSYDVPRSDGAELLLDGIPSLKGHPGVGDLNENGIDDRPLPVTTRTPSEYTSHRRSSSPASRARPRGP